MMRGEEMAGAGFPCRGDQQAIARPARRRFDVRLRRRALAHENARVEPDRPRGGHDVGRLTAGTATQTMIDGQDKRMRAASAPLRPARHADHQGERIGAAGDGERDQLGTSKRGQKVFEIGIAERSARRLSIPHWLVR